MEHANVWAGCGFALRVQVARPPLTQACNGYAAPPSVPLPSASFLGPSLPSATGTATPSASTTWISVSRSHKTNSLMQKRTSSYLGPIFRIRHANRWSRIGMQASFRCKKSYMLAGVPAFLKSRSPSLPQRYQAPHAPLPHPATLSVSHRRSNQSQAIKGPDLYCRATHASTLPCPMRLTLRRWTHNLKQTWRQSPSVDA